ncbi:amidohydrolase family protein [Deinococcus yavapaiensis]|uniref:Cytosine/adenosine deaminase-related metal-dependent hydrolase n=1 Tax=Deinococcus yavapaiensis KR-236 TaxID=694435 RepID=A0A318S9P5_9DEIO|nr:amidohydrolase family protein [Deinococcus yavapaiensis]PYE54780.1 cytosine/adenosine deaminase-related metal-dependent hydrolase [Deinococcus yavapaiensis KR-236]
MSLRLLTADVVYTGMGLPQRDAGVVVSDDTVAATGRLAELRSSFPHAVETYVGAVIAPLAVNAHTHLDMSSYDFQALPYFRWIPEVVIANREKRGLAGARLGFASLEASRVSAFGDIVWDPDVMTFLLSESTLPGVAYWEVLDPDPATAKDTFRKTVERVEAWRRLEGRGVKVGLSPHASYTVSHELFRLLADYARREALPMQIHVAEHGSELALFAAGTGPLAESFGRVVKLDLATIFGRSPDSALTPVSYLADLGVLDAKPTLIHMVHVTEDDVKIVASAGSTVVTCPRSNANLQCGTFDWPLFARLGVEVAVGTDSVASGETLDVHDELAFARAAYPNLDDRVFVRAAVKGGARVLGESVPFIRRGEPWREAYAWQA